MSKKNEKEQEPDKIDEVRRVGISVFVICMVGGLILMCLAAYSKEQQKLPETLDDVAYIECDCKDGKKAFRFFETGDEKVADYCGLCGGNVMDHGVVVFHEGRKCKDCGAIANKTYCEACGNYVYDIRLSNITYSDK